MNVLWCASEGAVYAVECSSQEELLEPLYISVDNFFDNPSYF